MTEFLKEIPIPKGAKTGQEIYDYLNLHPNYQCAKNCLWIKLENLAASQEYAKQLREILRDLRWTAKLSEDGSKMRLPGLKLMRFYAAIEELADSLSESLMLESSSSLSEQRKEVTK